MSNNDVNALFIPNEYVTMAEVFSLLGYFKVVGFYIFPYNGLCKTW